jgi:hypothetical protein
LNCSCPLSLSALNTMSLPYVAAPCTASSHAPPQVSRQLLPLSPSLYGEVTGAAVTGARVTGARVTRLYPEPIFSTVIFTRITTLATHHGESESLGLKV